VVTWSELHLSPLPGLDTAAFLDDLAATLRRGRLREEDSRLETNLTQENLPGQRLMWAHTRARIKSRCPEIRNGGGGHS
jgi:hypothetical protein